MSKAEELHQKLIRVSEGERSALLSALNLIYEVYCTQAFLELGYSSLYEYLLLGHRYSEGSAQRRIDAAKLIADVPDLAARINDGKLNLSQTTLLQEAIRQLDRVVTAKEKCDICLLLEGLNKSQSEEAIAKFFDIKIHKKTRVTTQADGSVRVQMTFTAEAFERLLAGQNLYSNQLTSSDLAVYFEFLNEKGIKAKQPKEKKSTATVAVTPKMRNEVIHDEQCCEFVDPKTKLRCRTRWKLQVDHIQPKWAGGTSERENLQVLCALHNRAKYRREAHINLV